MQQKNKHSKWIAKYIFQTEKIDKYLNYLTDKSYQCSLNYDRNLKLPWKS